MHEEGVIKKDIYDRLLQDDALEDFTETWPAEKIKPSELLMHEETDSSWPTVKKRKTKSKKGPKAEIDLILEDNCLPEEVVKQDNMLGEYLTGNGLDDLTLLVVPPPV